MGRNNKPLFDYILGRIPLERVVREHEAFASLLRDIANNDSALVGIGSLGKKHGLTPYMYLIIERLKEDGIIRIIMVQDESERYIRKVPLMTERGRESLLPLID